MTAGKGCAMESSGDNGRNGDEESETPSARTETGDNRSIYEPLTCCC